MDRPEAVLLMDDSPDDAERVREALAGGRYRVLVASDPGLALGLIESEGVAVILAALDDAVARGLALLVQAQRRYPLVPRIALSGRCDLARVAAAINEAEVLRLVRKPIEPDVLKAAVEHALGRAESLYKTREASEAVERRRIALIDLESDYPGISFVARGSEGYFIPRGRLRALGARLGGTPLAGLVPKPADDAASETPA